MKDKDSGLLIALALKNGAALAKLYWYLVDQSGYVVLPVRVNA